MSSYTDTMVETLQAQGTWAYSDCVEFAEKHGLSIRSVISKVKSLGLDYEPKPTPAAGAPRIRKADTVRSIARRLDVTYEEIEGLAKADRKALSALFRALL